MTHTVDGILDFFKKEYTGVLSETWVCSPNASTLPWFPPGKLKITDGEVGITATVLGITDVLPVGCYKLSWFSPDVFCVGSDGRKRV